MKKILPLLFFQLLILVSSFAQPSWQWGKRAGANGDMSESAEVISKIETDSKGNVYAFGYFNNYADVDGNYGVDRNDHNAIASWDCDGKLRWVKFMNVFLANATDFTMDEHDNIYIVAAAMLSDSVIIKPDTVIKLKKGEIWHKIIKINSDGKILNYYSYLSDSTWWPHSGYSIECDKKGGIHIFVNPAKGSYFDGKMVLEDTALAIITYNYDMQYQSHRIIDIELKNNPYPQIMLTEFFMTVDTIHNYYYLSGSIKKDYGDTYIAGKKVPYTDDEDGFQKAILMCWDNNGKLLWQKLGSIRTSVKRKPSLDQFGNIYTSVSMSNNDQFDEFTLKSEFSISSSSTVIKFDSKGKYYWGKAGESLTGAANGSMTFNKDNIVYGVFETIGKEKWDNWILDRELPSDGLYPYLMLFNQYTGTPLQLKYLRGLSGPVLAHSITVSKDNQVYIGGGFRSSLIVNKDTLHSRGGRYDWFLAKYGTDGCDCDETIGNITHTSTDGKTFEWSYSGDWSIVDSFMWDLSNGTLNKDKKTISATFDNTSGAFATLVLYTKCGIKVLADQLDKATNLNNYADKNIINIFPNPTSNELNIQHINKTTLDSYKIYNSLGQLVQSGKIINNNISVNALNNGIYWIQITDIQQYSIQQTFIKQ